MKFLILFLFVTNAFASDFVTIIASDSIPPYVMGDEPLAKELPGLQVEIVDAAFAKVGKKTIWKLMPNNRLGIEFKRSNIDAGLNIPALFSKIKSFSSAPLLQYRNCVIGSSRLKEKWKEQAPTLRIIGFQSAANIFAEIFGANVLATNKKYHEVTSQKTSVYHLLSGRADLVLSDALVFAYYAQTYFDPQFKKSDLVCLAEKKVDRHLGLKNVRLQLEFDRGLELLRKDGSYDGLIRKYQMRFSLLSQLETRRVTSFPPLASN